MKDPSKLKLFKIWMISWRHNCKMFYFNHIIKLKRSIDLVSKLRQIETTIDEHCFHNHFLYGYRLFFSKLFWLVDLFSCSNSSWLSHLKFIEIKEVFSNKMFPFYPPPLVWAEILTLLVCQVLSKCWADYLSSGFPFPFVFVLSPSSCRQPYFKQENFNSLFQKAKINKNIMFNWLIFALISDLGEWSYLFKSEKGEKLTSIWILHPLMRYSVEGPDRYRKVHV